MSWATFTVCLRLYPAGSKQLRGGAAVLWQAPLKSAEARNPFGRGNYVAVKIHWLVPGGAGSAAPTAGSPGDVCTIAAEEGDRFAVDRVLLNMMRNSTHDNVRSAR